MLGDAGIRGRSWSCRRCGFLLRNGDRRRFAACPDTGGTRRLRAGGDLYLDRPLYRRTDWRGAGRSSWSDPFTGGSNTFTSGAGFLGGGQIGANYQWNVLVLGVEGDFNWTGIKGNGGDFLGDAIGAETQWTSTVAGRVGAAFNRLLIYGKGGAAFARDRSTFTDLAGHSASSAFTRTGWTAGVGLEYGITANWSAKIEYDYLSFGSQPLNFTTATPTTYASSASLKAQEIKAGINFRFGGPP